MGLLKWLQKKEVIGLSVESRSKKIASQGLGPFFSDTYHAFLEGICVSCEREISDDTKSRFSNLWTSLCNPATMKSKISKNEMKSCVINAKGSH